MGIDQRPVRMLCDGSGTWLELQARPGVLRAGRSGGVKRGTQTMELRSAHRIQGTPPTQDEPAGYVLLEQGRPVPALDRLRGRPLLRLAAREAGQSQLAVEAALTWALSWEPAA